jgi:hypothetical protein
MVGAAIAIGAGTAISAGAGLMGSAKASAAAKDAAALQAAQFEQTRGDLLPYNQYGQSVLPNMQALAFSGPNGPGGKNYLAMAEDALPGTMTQAELEATPGYQFNLSQGLKATQSAAAAKGLGVSGAALKGAARFATGLADSTYQQQFANQQTRYSDFYNLNTGQQSNLQNQFARLSGIATLGENAAAQTGALGTASAKSEGQGLMAAGQYDAAGLAGIGNSVNSGINSYLGYNALQNMTARGGTKGTPANP